MPIHELKICFDLNPESKSKTLNKYAKKFDLGYFFVDSEDGHCYLLDKDGNEKDISLIESIGENMVPIDIKKIVIPCGIKKIDRYAFYSCENLIDITISNGVPSIGEKAFWYCSKLISMTIPNSVTSIGSDAFAYCNSLTSMTIPDSVTSIGWGVFYDCNRLDKIVFKSKTINQVKAMKNYPWGIEDESIIKAELN